MVRAGRASDNIEAAVADKAGLHAISTGIVGEYPVVGTYEPLTDVHFSHRPHVGILWKVTHDRSRELAYVARRRDLIGVGKTVCIGKFAVRHAKTAGHTVHVVDKGLVRPGNRFRQHHGYIV